MRFVTLILATAIGAAAGQDDVPAFEVATVKRSALPQPGRYQARFPARGGPGTTRPTHFECRGCPLALLLAKAYDLDLYQVSGPDWVQGNLFEVDANVPDKTTVDQFHRMLQTLLSERFRLKFRREARESAGYELSLGSGGVRLLHEAGSPVDPPEMNSAPQMKTDPQGFPILLPGMTIAMSNGRYRRHTQEAIGDLTKFLALQLGKPVIDRTGLNGRYDITLSFIMPRVRPGKTDEPEIPGPSLIDAIRSIGLKLESKKVLVDYLVVEHADRVPIDN